MALLGFIFPLFISPGTCHLMVEDYSRACQRERGKKKEEEEEKKPRKNHFAMTGIWTHGLCLQSRACYPLDHSALKFLPTCRFGPAVHLFPTELKINVSWLLWKSAVKPITSKNEVASIGIRQLPHVPAVTGSWIGSVSQLESVKTSMVFVGGYPPIMKALLAAIWKGDEGIHE